VERRRGTASRHAKGKTTGYRILALTLVFLAGVIPASAQEKLLTFIHTNDLHSHMMPFAPEMDFIPHAINADRTLGGWARIATVIKQEKAARSTSVFVVDAGDFTMGSLFHMLAREEALELELMKEMDYDIVTLGNHEFDLMPGGLARIIQAAQGKGKMPEIVFASALFSEASPKDGTLEEVFRQGLVKPYTVRETEGVRIGFFGILGRIASVEAPFASPVTFRDPVETARQMVQVLREKERVDVVVCLSHSGLYVGKTSEDEDLAKKVPGIDVIISGHSHTYLDQPLVLKDTLIVQAGEYGKAVGVMDLQWDGKRLQNKDYRLVRIDDSIPADPTIQGKIDSFIDMIDERVLSEHGLGYRQVIGRTAFDLTLEEDESTLGNLIADSIRWYVNKHDYDPSDPVTKVKVAIEANGVIRDNLMKGKTGKLAVADVFRTIPLGIGMDDTMGYPLVTCYVYASELKKAMEIVTSVYPLKGSAYFLQVSGIKFTYNPYRIPFDRVTHLWIGSEEEGYEPLDYSSSNRTLYRVAANIYDTTFLKIIGKFTYNLLDIVPKNRKGDPIDDPADYRVDADKTREGVQELKEWVGVVEYIRSFEDRTGDGLPDIPEKYRHPLGRIERKASLNPVNLLSRAAPVTWVAFGILILTLLGLGLVTSLGVKRIRRKKQGLSRSVRFQ
jgi:5'-nucleotidase / UDP-sugar diphosphatase